MGVFIRVEIAEGRCTPDLGRKLVDVCPVDVFVWTEGRVAMDPDNEDECTLCGLCLQAYPEGAVRILRLYAEPT